MDEIEQYLKELKEKYGNICPDEDFEKGMATLLSQKRAKEKLKALCEAIPSVGKGTRILEIGSGAGVFAPECLKNNIKYSGLEPEETLIRYQANRLKFNKAIQGIGEELPFKNNSVEIVVSYQVLEHAKNPEKVLHEAIRVIKPGGYLYFVIPNYNSFWEGHYGVFWFPLLSKSKTLAKLYIKLRGRDTRLIDDLVFITPRMVLKYLSAQPVEILSLGVEVWKQRMNTLEFSNWGSFGTFGRYLNLLKKMRLIPLFILLGEKFDLYYPIILISRKKQ